MDSNLTEILITLITLIFTAVVAPSAAHYFSSKAKNEITQAFITDVELAVINAVNATSQTYTDDLKAKAEDGELTPAEQSEALQSAIETASDLLSASAKEYLVSNGLEIGKYLETLIEAQIKRSKT